MWHVFALGAVLLFTISSSATPLATFASAVTLPLARRFNSTGIANIAEADRSRIKLLKSQIASDASKSTKRSVFSAPITNEAVSYSVSVGIGSPATIYSLLVDTSSAVTWVGGGKPYVHTSTSMSAGDTVIGYHTAGFFDTVTVGQMVVPDQFVAVSETTLSGFGSDGGLGLGSILSDGGLYEYYVSKLRLTVYLESGFPVNPSIVNNAFSQGQLNVEEVGIYFQPTTSLSITNGELSFGGVDSSKIVGQIQTVAITSTSPASQFIGINQQVTLGTSPVVEILPETAGIVDASTTLVLLATDAFTRYKAAVGAVLDSETGLLKITPAQFATLGSLFFNINGVSYEFTANAQIWPRSLNTAIGGNADSIYVIVSDIGAPSGQGFDFVNGFTFIERFYTVYNSALPTFGLAQTDFTFATTN
ncbi:hypothetical protein PHLGIDRAFT_25390 [Phlebiopsis gigantea 11061_1 CR5-6]|uniref:Peptidase A1 domain-containing protein n=1 Tax=Phlebiopsis gigantea (strain 11061_1 CR5-6) TaxID=745531 RepID=A0A0C3S7Q0_PHLG1|nr:hypothetical protein PHLGIDRAFT_25390 [Phlebiopsis gigantea 11061_1 CR5-6]